ncbi:phage antirepressor KilAC domain-containing protein [Chromobacterium subtsugae]|uniref:phage antirepressor KilAC domain-containing protein n=1 Tax=Chromobacterium subtsugae TaxID=251747 RepID=UPI0007F87761|nr:phage regulatory protein/antirepressor Ant [Chromobacterium subtsugae]
MNLVTMNGQPMTMSSREIAELCEKEHKNVIRDIRVMLDELGGGSDLSHVQESKDLRGYTSSISLPKDLTLTLIAGYNVRLRKRIIDRWMELEQKVAAPVLPDFQDPVAAARAWADQLEGRQIAEQQKVLLEHKVAEQAPKVQFHDDVANTINCQTMDEVAKELGTGRNRLYAFLREKGVLMQSNEPYQRFIDQGYFRVIPSPWRKRGELQMGQKTVVTGKGMTYIHRLINNLAVELPANDRLAERSA